MFLYCYSLSAACCCAKGQVIRVVLRGEIFRVGSRHSREQTGCSRVTREVVGSIKVHVLEALQRLGFVVDLIVDVVCPEERSHEAEDVVFVCT